MIIVVINGYIVRRQIFVCKRFWEILGVQKISKQQTAASYAKAFFEAAKDCGETEAVFEAVQTLLEAVTTAPELWQRLARPDDGEGKGAKILSEVLGALKFLPVMTETLKLLEENGRFGLLEEVLRFFCKLYYEDKGIVAVDVVSATALSEAQQNKLKKTLEAKLGAAIVLNLVIRPEVLGGLAVSFKSYLIDDTLLGKLKRIEKTLK